MDSKTTFRETDEFIEWVKGMSDQHARLRVVKRLRSAMLGNFGDCKPIEGGVWEMRIDYGPGYRVYYARADKTIYWLILGGDKRSQKRDIKSAKELWRAIQEGKK